MHVIMRRPILTGLENAVAGELGSQNAKQGLDLIEPTGVSEDMDQVQSLLLLGPRMGLLSGLRGTVVEYGVQILAGVATEKPAQEGIKDVAVISTDQPPVETATF